VTLTGDKQLASDIIETTKVIAKYGFYFSSIDIGIKYGPQDLSFSEMMLYSWIKDGLNNGRKT